VKIMVQNPQKKTELIWLTITIIGVIIIFLPGFLGIDGLKGGFAISVWAWFRIFFKFSL
jgi:hypothetical protein